MVRTVRVADGVRVAVQDLGTGPAVLFVPGFGLDHTVWDSQVHRLAGGRRVICVDQRGHGASDAPLTGYDLDRLARDLVAVLEVLDVSSVVVVGHSLGGQVAFRLAVVRPDLVAGLVLVASNGVRSSRSEGFPFGRPPEPTLSTMLAAEEADRPGSRRRALGCFAGEPPPATLDWLFAMSMRMPSWAAFGCYETLLCSDQLDALAAVTCPVLQILGADDPVQSSRGGRWLATQLADSRLVELADCGHYPMLEQAAEFDRALVDFLDGIVERLVSE